MTTNYVLRSTNCIVGIDEAGRGPLAGPVFVAAVCVFKNFGRPTSKILRNVRDSKKLSEKQREEWFSKIEEWRQERILEYAFSYTTSSVIDKKGIVPATQDALSRAVQSISVDSEAKIILDGGLRAPSMYNNQETIIRGDEKEPLIALASIVAKVKRDEMMFHYHKEFPQYRFDRHKGYGTKLHREAIAQHGPCRIHRLTFLNFN